MRLKGQKNKKEDAMLYHLESYCLDECEHTYIHVIRVPSSH